MSLLQWIVAVLGGILALYIVVRVISAAYFKSKQDYDRLSTTKE